MPKRDDFYLEITKEQFDSIHNTWLKDPDVKATKQHIRNYSWDKYIYKAYSKKYKKYDVLYPGLILPSHEAHKANLSLPLAELTELHEHITRLPYTLYRYWLSFPDMDYHYGGNKDKFHKKYETILMRHMPRWLNILYRKKVRRE